jgi:hypothetical protein
VRPLQVGLKFARHALVAFYVLAFVAMPFAHHDLACHLKSSTHCATCHVGTSTDPNSAAPLVYAAVLADAGRTDDAPCTAVSSPALLPSAGRSPPTTTL